MKLSFHDLNDQLRQALQDPVSVHQRRCAWIRIHCRERKQGAAKEVARLLNEIEEPLDVGTCRALAKFLDPGSGTQKPGKKTSIPEKFRRHRDAACIYGVLLGMVGTDGGPRDRDDARARACEILECEDRTLDNYVAPPMNRLYKWVRDGADLTGEDLKQLWIDFEKKERRKS